MVITFLGGIDASGIVEAGHKGESLTDRGIWISLLTLLISLLIWYARIQASKEVKLTDRLVELTKDYNEAIKGNSLSLQAFKTTLEQIDRDVRQLALELKGR
jgi:hypothetical protein